MEQHEIERLEIEANAELQKHVANHKAALHKARVRMIRDTEQLSELEPGQAPIYTHYIGARVDDVINNFNF